MHFAWQTLRFERRRYLPAVLAVAFSGVLIALLVGIFWGLIGVVSTPIVLADAQVWVGYPNTQAVDLGRPMPRHYINQLWGLPEIERADEYVQGTVLWKTASETTELCIVAGCSLDDQSLGPVRLLSAEQREALKEPGTVIVDAGDARRLEIDRVGQRGSVMGQEVRVVGFIRGMISLTGPYAICSLQTARSLLKLRPDQSTFLLARCQQPEQVPGLAEAAYPNMTAFEAQDFALKSEDPLANEDQRALP